MTNIATECTQSQCLTHDNRNRW